MGQKIGKKEGKGAAMPRTKGECELKSENRKGEDPLCGKDFREGLGLLEQPIKCPNMFWNPFVAGT